MTTTTNDCSSGNGPSDPTFATDATPSDTSDSGEKPSGLAMHVDFITTAEEQELLTWINAQPWEAGPGRRRVQQYGYKYLYDRKSTSPVVTTAIPKVFSDVMTRLVERKLFPRAPDQIIVNEYQPGQGISPHVDHPRHFGSPIGTLRLSGALPMVLALGHSKSYEVWLPRRSFLVLDGEARSTWTHSIVARKTDVVLGRSTLRPRSISVTFRLMRT